MVFLFWGEHCRASSLSERGARLFFWPARLAMIWNYMSTKRGRHPILHSTITCPHCGHRTKETMPTDACLFFFDCPACNARLKPKKGDCCVFCSYGSVACPPIQTGKSCGA